MDKLKIIRRAKQLVYFRRTPYMCDAFKTAIREEFGDSVNYEIWLCENLPLFNRTIAVEKFKAFGQFAWWNSVEVQHRLDYFDWLIEKYSK